MTQREATQLDKAIERATEHGIIVLAQGRMKADNAKFYLTSSHSTDGAHVVRQYGNHLQCDCKARVICAHRASVHMFLSVQAAKRQAHAEAVEAALEAEATAVREAIQQASARPQVRGVNDVRPLNSVFK